MKTLFSFIAILFCTFIYAQDKMIVHTATVDNIADNVTYIDHPDLNNNPSACLNFVHNWNPGNGAGVYNDNPDGLWYSSGNQRWAIYNENIDDMIVGASFNVYIADEGQCVDHVATAANTFGHITDIDDALFNENNPGPYAFMNTYYNPNSIYNTGIWGMYFDTGVERRSIYDENINPVPDGAAFKIAIPGASTTRFTHTTSAANSDGNITTIDHPELNGNPDATFIFSHYWGVGGASTEIYLTAKTAVWYTGTNWSIFTEDISNMPEGVAFDIAIGANETLATNQVENITQATLYPNPAENNLIITTPNSLLKSITLFTIIGNKVATYKGLESSEKNIDVSSLTSGTYLATVETENGVQTLKFIIQ